MADNRMYLRCKGCGEAVVLAKMYVSTGWFSASPPKEKGRRIIDFIEKHQTCCNSIGYIDLHVENDREFEPFDLIYENDPDFALEEAYMEKIGGPAAMRRFWDEEKDAVLRRDYPTMHLGSLAVRIGTTVAGLKSRAKILGLRREVNAHHPWSAGQLDYLKRHYADTPIDVLAEETGHCRDSVYNKAYALGLHRAVEFRQELGRRVSTSPKSRANRFEKGHVPFNKGKREHEFRSPEGIARCARTQFKKGGRPHNAREVGYECFRRTAGKGYVYIKVAEGGKMVMKHRWLWEQAHGPIPEGCNVVFRDGDTRNCTLENLELVTRGEHARRAIGRETPETREARIRKATDTRRRLIRLDKARIHFGLEPRSKLVKRW